MKQQSEDKARDELKKIFGTFKFKKSTPELMEEIDRVYD